MHEQSNIRHIAVLCVLGSNISKLVSQRFGTLVRIGNACHAGGDLELRLFIGCAVACTTSQ